MRRDRPRPQGPRPPAPPPGPARGDPRSGDTWVFPFPGLSLAKAPPENRPTYWTRGLGDPPTVYGERLRLDGEMTWRAFDPFRSKLGAALIKGLREPRLVPGGRVLYLGAASGTTASHVADLVGRKGAVFAVEKSPRPFRQLLEVAHRWPNLYPVFGDAHEPRRYAPWVPPVETLYLDVAQPDQVDIALEHARLFLRPGGGLLMALKGPSLRRRTPVARRVPDAQAALARAFDLAPPVPLEPFHRGHAMLSGTYRER